MGLFDEFKPELPKPAKRGKQKKTFVLDVGADGQVVCYNCGKKSPKEDIQVVHRVPKQWGGDSYIDNKEALCNECAKYKWDLERIVPQFDATDAIRRQWVKLAFQGDMEKFGLFISDMSVWLAHFREIRGDGS